MYRLSPETQDEYDDDVDDGDDFIRNSFNQNEHN